MKGLCCYKVTVISLKTVISQFKLTKHNVKLEHLKEVLTIQRQ